EILVLITREYVIDKSEVKAEKISLRKMMSGFITALKYPITLFRSTAIGVGIGLLPAAGGSLSSFSSYLITKSLSKNPDSFGKGNPEGVVAPESANSSTTSGAIMTTLALGVPGSITTAVMLGA